MTNRKCADICSLYKYEYSATSDGYICYCLTEKADLEFKFDASKCNVPCIGNSSESCGGDTLYLNTLHEISYEIVEVPFILKLNYSYTNYSLECYNITQADTTMQTTVNLAETSLASTPSNDVSLVNETEVYGNMSNQVTADDLSQANLNDLTSLTTEENFDDVGDTNFLNEYYIQIVEECRNISQTYWVAENLTTNLTNLSMLNQGLRIYLIFIYFTFEFKL